MADSQITISGNTAADPELRFTQQGTPVVSFTVMQNLRREQSNGQWAEVAKNGMKVTAWRDLAEHISESFKKGDRVIVTGRLEPQQWQDRESGQERYGWQLVADDAGHSLRWATSQAAKAEKNGGRQQGQQGGYGQPQNDPWGGAGNQGGYDAPPF